MDRVQEIREALEDFDWTQKGLAFGEVTHSIHKYPAKLIPQIPNLFISNFCETGDTVLDPYCGSGTTLLEARRQGYNSIGFDLNPLARFISDMKTRELIITVTKKEIAKFKKGNFDWKENKNYTLDMPFEEIGKYFPLDTIWQINHYLQMIDNCEISDQTKDILRLAISDILRKVSFTRLGDFKIYMIPKPERKNFRLDAEEEFLDKIDIIVKKMTELRKETYQNVRVAEVSIFDYNSSSKNPMPSKVTNERIKLIVTSPPYGDSRTTVAYGEFSWFSNRLLKLYPNVRQGVVDKELMGGRNRSTRLRKIGSLHSVLKKINRKRRKEVASFFYEYQLSMNKISKILQPGGVCCYAVANRNVDGQVIPMDEFTRIYFEECGLVHVGTYTRDIIGKTLARRNNKTDLMNKEIIVVMYKPNLSE